MPAGATYEPIATTTLGSAQANITFSSISGSYTDLKLVISTSPSNATAAFLQIELNADTTASNYSSLRVMGDGSATYSNMQTGTLGYRVGLVAGSSTIPSLNIFNFFSYAGSTNKTYLVEGSADINGSGQVNRMVGLWRNTAAITSIKLSINGGTNMVSGTTATLYGIKAA